MEMGSVRVGEAELGRRRSVRQGQLAVRMTCRDARKRVASARSEPPARQPRAALSNKARDPGDEMQAWGLSVGAA